MWEIAWLTSMDSAESNTAETFLLDQESRQRRQRCGEHCPWSLQENIEAAVQGMIDFEGPEGARRTCIPNDPYILDLFMHQMRASVLEQCGGRA